MPIVPWKIKASKHLHRDTYLTVRVDTCEDDQGRVIDPYYVLEYTDWVHVVAFDAEGRVLVIRQYRHAMGEISNEIPGGAMDPEDESPLEAMKRELLEETGLTAGRYVSLGRYSPNPATHANWVHCFAAYDLEKVAEPNFDETENIETDFMGVEELLELMETGGFVHFLQLPTVYLALRKAGKLRLK